MQNDVAEERRRMMSEREILYFLVVVMAFSNVTFWGLWRQSELFFKYFGRR